MPLMPSREETVSALPELSFGILNGEIQPNLMIAVDNWRATWACFGLRSDRKIRADHGRATDLRWPEEEM